MVQYSRCRYALLSPTAADPIFLGCPDGSCEHLILLWLTSDASLGLLTECFTVTWNYNIPVRGTHCPTRCPWFAISKEDHKHVHAFALPGSVIALLQLVISSKHHPHYSRDLTHFLPANYLCLALWTKYDCLLKHNDTLHINAMTVWVESLTECTNKNSL